jgi:hypothetical protein
MVEASRSGTAVAQLGAQNQASALGNAAHSSVGTPEHFESSRTHPCHSDERYRTCQSHTE